MTIIERALDLVTNDSRVGLGSGHAAQAFVRALAERVRRGQPASPRGAYFRGDSKSGPERRHSAAEPCRGRESST